MFSIIAGFGGGNAIGFDATFWMLGANSGDPTFSLLVRTADISICYAPHIYLGHCFYSPDKKSVMTGEIS